MLFPRIPPPLEVKQYRKRIRYVTNPRKRKKILGTHEEETVPQLRQYHKGGERKMKATKEVYVQPVLTKHDLLRDITASYSGSGGDGGVRDRIEDVVCRVFPRLPRCN